MKPLPSAQLHARLLFDRIRHNVAQLELAAGKGMTSCWSGLEALKYTSVQGFGPWVYREAGFKGFSF